MRVLCACLMVVGGPAAFAASLDWTASDAWRVERRGTAELERKGAVLRGKMILWKAQEFTDFELRCRARIREGVKDGAVWIRFRYRSDNEHYALALRGAPADDLYLFRFSPGGHDRLLAQQPLGFTPPPAEWYDLRVACAGPRIEVFLNREASPRLSVLDDPPIAAGLVGVGGGYRQAEYEELRIDPEASPPPTAPSPPGRGAGVRHRARRRDYRPVKLPRPTGLRQTTPLDGRWLFLPDQERAPGQDPRDPSLRDERWHLLDVPAFWTPVTWWIYGPGEGTSDRWVQRERERIAGLGFDASQTHAGWYRQWIELPRAYQGRRLALQFDAVAMACEVWVNGRHVASHAGMFSPFEVELPPEALRLGGRNLVALFVTDGAYQASPDAARILGPEAAARLGRDFLSRLPRGMYGRSAGIWQPVRLLVTPPLHVAEVFVKPACDGFAAEVTLAGPPVAGSIVRGTVSDPKTGQLLAQTGTQPADLAKPVVIGAHGLAPKLWSPDQPNLYSLRTELLGPNGAVIDSDERALGFRTFEAKGSRLYLNGRPYWLRGANHSPSGLLPNSREAAHAFLRRLHEGNTVVTRSHGSPFTETWLQAADEEGVGVSLEGVWPWVMINDTEPPSPALVEAWQADWLGVMRRLRSHPSLLFWTLNNESFWYRAQDPAVRRRKWEIATRLVRATRELDPTRPVVCDSGYVRHPQLFESELRPNGFDDGDLDDVHSYYGWYAAAPWELYPALGAASAPPLERPFSGTRPAISQEFSTGYPDNDSGHPTRKYVDRHYVAQAWVGDCAYADRDPAVFLARHAWLTKELVELARRHRTRLCGLLAFASTNWFRSPFDPETLEAYPVYQAMKTAMAPVLVSTELRRRHFYGGDTLSLQAYLINDSADGADLPTVNVEAQLLGGDGALLARTAVQLPPVPYYENRSVAMALPAPPTLPAPGRGEYTLLLTAKAGETPVAENRYPLLGGDRAWAGTEEVLKATSKDLTAGEGGTLIANGASGVQTLRARPELQQFVEGGGRILVMNAGAAVSGLLPDVVDTAVDWQPEIVNFEDEASPLLDGLEPWDACWFDSERWPPVAATGGFRLKPAPRVNVIGTAIRPHGYLKDPADIRDHTAAVVFEVSVGKGKVIVSELNVAAAKTDPIASRLASNLLKHLAQVQP